MKNRPLVTLAFVLINGLFATSALADEASSDGADPEENSEKPVADKSGKNPIAWCALYEHFKLLTGEFNGSNGTDKLDRAGVGTGVRCTYSNRSRLALTVGTELYVGRLNFRHEQDTLRGTASYIEVGFKEWVRATLNLNGVKISTMLGLEKTNSGSFKLKSLQMDLGGGYLDLTKFGAEHLSSDGELEILELGLDVEFPFRRKFSFSFGTLYQKPHVVVRVKVDDEVRKTLEAFNYDITKVEREYNRSTNFFYLTPGVKWSGERLSISLTVPWGVFVAKQWSWGAGLKTELKF